MSEDLKRFMVKLASEPDTLADFMRDPRSAMDHAGLLPEQQDIVMSGDQGRIYATIKGMPLPPAAPAPSPLQLPTVVSTMLDPPHGQPGSATAGQPAAQAAMNVAAHLPAAQPAMHVVAPGAQAGQPAYYYAVPQGQPIYYIVGWPYWPQR
jgi:hypothetical protein